MCVAHKLKSRRKVFENTQTTAGQQNGAFVRVYFARVCVFCVFVWVNVLVCEFVYVFSVCVCVCVCACACAQSR